MLYTNGKRQCPLAIMWHLLQHMLHMKRVSERQQRVALASLLLGTNTLALIACQRKKLFPCCTSQQHLSVFFCSCIFFTQTQLGVFFFSSYFSSSIQLYPKCQEEKKKKLSRIIALEYVVRKYKQRSNTECIQSANLHLCFRNTRH